MRAQHAEVEGRVAGVDHLPVEQHRRAAGDQHVLRGEIAMHQTGGPGAGAVGDERGQGGGMLGPVRGDLPVVRVEPQRVEQLGPFRPGQPGGDGPLVQHRHAFGQRRHHREIDPAGQQFGLPVGRGRRDPLQLQDRRFSVRPVDRGDQDRAERAAQGPQDDALPVRPARVGGPLGLDVEPPPRRLDHPALVDDRDEAGHPAAQPPHGAVRADPPGRAQRGQHRLEAVIHQAAPRG
ncbi:MAG TPA: hypothetical protein VFQ68_18760 [Streptosporangiaceae bacterium]|nr:hypothetical protein [Streptosporangiaceae bacterium]